MLMRQALSIFNVTTTTTPSDSLLDTSNSATSKYGWEGVLLLRARDLNGGAVLIKIFLDLCLVQDPEAS